jgi:hypothetical protein
MYKYPTAGGSREEAVVVTPELFDAISSQILYKLPKII